jgi:hypothetical protein
MKKKLSLLSLTLILAFCGTVYAAGGWNGFATVRVTSAGKAILAPDPAIVVKGKTFVPLSLLKQAGISVTGDTKSINIELPKQDSKGNDINDIVQQIKGLGGYNFSITDYDKSFNASAEFMIVPEIDKDPSPLSKMPTFKKILFQLARTGSQYVTVYCVVSPPFGSSTTEYKTIGHIQVLSQVIQQYMAGKVSEDYLNSHWSIHGFDSGTSQSGSTGTTGLKMTAKDIAKLSVDVGYVEPLGINGNLACSGSGVLTTDGYFITNYHVMACGNTGKMRVKLDGETYTNGERGSYLFANKDTDIVGIPLSTSYDSAGYINGKTPKTGFIIKKDTSLPQVGDKVFAIGSPLGLENTVSEGIVSGLRTINGMTMIQHTCNTTHGSSGGALIDENGFLIGITSAGYDGTNLNFAIPISYVKDEIDKLNKK